jgi:hypothetical protein
MKFLIPLVFVLVSLTGCDYGLTQEACMKEGAVLYKGDCVDFMKDVPDRDKDKVVQDVADELNITFDEALGRVFDLEY